MEYRTFGPAGWRVSVLGLEAGFLRADAASTVLRAALARGINIIDFTCPDAMRQESLCRRVSDALRERAADKIYLFLRLPSVFYKADFDLASWLRTRRSWLGDVCIDAFSFAGLNRETWPRLRDSGLLDQARQAVADGTVKTLGFDFYDHPLHLRPVLHGFDAWTFTRLYASFMDADRLPGVTGLADAAAREDLTVAALEPLLFGRLTENIPAPVADLWQSADPAELALRWTWGLPAVSTAFVHLTSPELVDKYADLADGPAPLSVQEEILMSRVRDAYRTLKPVPCTTCWACMPCPKGIKAPRIFELYNDAVMYGNRQIPAALYWAEGHSIAGCDDCEECSTRCGRSIDIPARLREAADYLVRT